MKTFHLHLCCCYITSVVSDSVWPQRRQPTRLLCPWDAPGKNTGVGCHFLLQCMKVKSESEVVQSCPTLSGPMESSLAGSMGFFQARVLEWGAIRTAITKQMRVSVWHDTSPRQQRDFYLVLVLKDCWWLSGAWALLKILHETLACFRVKTNVLIDEQYLLWA